MGSPTENDIFARSLGGDRRARTELFKKFVRDSSRVRRFGAGYPDISDFLHDTFNNLLRTGHSWDKESSLSPWVESVAAWTALIHERQKDMRDRAARNDIRMCAEIEGEDASRGEVLSAYVPPDMGVEDSPAIRILALLSESERAVFRTRAIDNRTWDDAATAAGKPVSAVGPIFTRAITRLARFFGAPPPMDDDLVPVFSRAADDPLKPAGRSISLRLDGAFYSMTPEMRRIGLTTSYDARAVVLWDTAAAPGTEDGALRQHLDECHYCTDLLRALVVMQQALRIPLGAEFNLCPGSFNLTRATGQAREALDVHLAQCPMCRQEKNQAVDGQAPRQDAEVAVHQSTAVAGRKIAWVSAVVLVLGLTSFFGYRYLAARQTGEAKSATRLTSEQSTPTVAVDERYRDLVQNVPLDDKRILASVLPQNRTAVKFALDQYSLGQTSQSLTVSSQLAEKGNDPGAQMLYAMSLYTNSLMTDGYREMLKSEAMTPRDTFRCWVMFQFALMVGDKKVMEREAGHVAVDPAYKDPVKKIMDTVHERG